MEIGYKKQQIESNDAKIGEWQDVSSDEGDKFIYFNGVPDPEYADTMKKLLGIDSSEEDE